VGQCLSSQAIISRANECLYMYMPLAEVREMPLLLDFYRTINLSIYIVSLSLAAFSFVTTFVRSCSIFIYSLVSNAPINTGDNQKKMRKNKLLLAATTLFFTGFNRFQLHFLSWLTICILLLSCFDKFFGHRKKRCIDISSCFR